MDNPLRLLAEMPLRIYLTTCQHEFIETALAQTGRKDPVSRFSTGKIHSTAFHPSMTRSRASGQVKLALSSTICSGVGSPSGA